MIDLIGQAGFLVLGVICIVIYAKDRDINNLLLGTLFVIVGSQYGIRYEISSLEERLLQQEDVVCIQNTQEEDRI